MTRVVHDEDGPSALAFGWDSNPWVWAIEFKRAEGPIPEGRRSRPVLFRGELVLAILEGRKTQTRRPVKLRPAVAKSFETPHIMWGDAGHSGAGAYICEDEYREDGSWFLGSPYGLPGDRLWVKETHAIIDYPAWPDLPHTFEPATVLMAKKRCAYYRAGFDRSHGFRWRPSIHMPRWASRVEVEIVSVRVERLHAITEDDARAEGVEPAILVRKNYPSARAADIETPDYRKGFERKWREIHGDGANP